MAAPLGEFDADLQATAWFDPSTYLTGWYDYGLPFEHELLAPPSANADTPELFEGRACISYP